MKRIILTLGALAVSALMALAQQPTREQMEAAIAQMPQIPTSEAYTVGHLDNGLTYFIRHNELPKGRAEFYLATNVGAIEEEYPAQDGLAHFLEHMCFNGTAHFLDKQILDYRDVSEKKLDRVCYRILGKWVSRTGIKMEFRDDGTCTIDGRDYCFYAATYAFYLGDRPEELTAEWKIHRCTSDHLSIENVKAKAQYSLTPDKGEQ